LAGQLDFPEWYGRNWDAFWDLISDPEIVRMPDKLILLGFQGFSKKLPREAQLFRQCFSDLKERQPTISCEVIYS
jgi:RNAse (barnase) inhibitor barstar